MKKFVPLYFLLLTVLPFSAISQEKTFKKKNIIWFIPNVANQVNGIAAGMQAMNLNDDSLTINGLNADIGLAMMMAIPYVVDYELRSKKKKVGSFLEGENDTAYTIINGLSASLGGELGFTVNGVNMTFGFTGAANLNGLSISGIFSHCTTFRGLCISGVSNRAKKGFGIQLGLFNYCTRLKGIQLGLWNKSGKRGLPFINWGT